MGSPLSAYSEFAFITDTELLIIQTSVIICMHRIGHYTYIVFVPVFVFNDDPS